MKIEIELHDGDMKNKIMFNVKSEIEKKDSKFCENVGMCILNAVVFWIKKNMKTNTNKMQQDSGVKNG